MANVMCKFQFLLCGLYLLKSRTDIGPALDNTSEPWPWSVLVWEHNNHTVVAT